MRSHPMAALVAVAVLAGLTPADASAQTVILPDRGTVVEGARGTAEELRLTVDEAARAFGASSGLTVGIVLPGPGEVPEDMDVAAIAQALTTSVERNGARVLSCGPPTDAAACIDGFVADKAAAVVVIGSQGDLVEPTRRANDQAITAIVSIGDTRVAPLSVVIDSDPITRAFEQGRSGGAPTGVPRSKGSRTAIVASAVPPGQADPATDALTLGLLEVAPRATVMAVLGPPAIETTEDLAAAVAQLPPSGVLIGEGVRLTRATQDGLDALPAALRVVAYRCTPSLTALIDLGSRIRGCIARSDEGAGEAAGDAIMSLLIGRDVPAFVDAPLYTYRGTVTIGPGRVQLGRRLAGENLLLADEERGAAAAALAGRVIGIISPHAPGAREPAATRATREAVEAGAGSLGATTSGCFHGKDRALAADCVADLVAAEVAAIVVLDDRADLVAPIAAALAAGIPVFGAEAPFLGESGAVYVDLDERAVARLQGRMAGAYAATTWPDHTGAYAAVLNARGAAGRDPLADAAERSASLANPNVVPVGRFKATARSARAGLVAALRALPDLRLLIGPFAARGAVDAGSLRRPRPPRDLVGFGLRCDDAMRRRIAAGGRIKGCVEVDPAATGELVVRAMVRMFAGGTVAGLIEVPIRPFPADAATPAVTVPPG